MVKSLKMTLVAAAALGATSLASGSASAMPMAGLDKTAPVAGKVENVRWVCGPFRCFWRPGYYGWRPYYGYRWGYGWRRRYWW